MIQIRPVSDLRNKFPEIENLVNEGNPVYLTKNGYGTMVVLSLIHILIRDNGTIYGGSIYG